MYKIRRSRRQTKYIFYYSTNNKSRVAAGKYMKPNTETADRIKRQISSDKFLCMLKII
jgi:hypothetical protein